MRKTIFTIGIILICSVAYFVDAYGAQDNTIFKSVVQINGIIDYNLYTKYELYLGYKFGPISHSSDPTEIQAFWEEASNKDRNDYLNYLSYQPYAEHDFYSFYQSFLAYTDQKNPRKDIDFTEFQEYYDFSLLEELAPEYNYSFISIGSGTVISPDGYVLTNYHVILDYLYGPVVGLEVCTYTSPYAINNCEELYEVVDSTPSLDLALLKPSMRLVGEEYEEIAPLDRKSHVSASFSTKTTNSEDLPDLREPITIIGYPGGPNTYQINATKGIITGYDAYNCEIDNCDMVEEVQKYLPNPFVYQLVTDALVTPGNSGGAAFDENDNFIGIPSSGTVGISGGDYGYVIPVTLINAWLKHEYEEGLIPGNPVDYHILRGSAEENLQKELLDKQATIENKQDLLEQRQESLEENQSKMTYNLYYLYGGLGILSLLIVLTLFKRRQKRAPSYLENNHNSKNTIFMTNNLSLEVSPETEVYKKITGAGWAVRLFGGLLMALSLLFSLLLLLPVFIDECDAECKAVLPQMVLISIGLLAVAVLITYFANKLYKGNLSLAAAKIYLVIFTIVFLPFCGGIVGLIVIWYTISALMAIHEYKYASRIAEGNRETQTK